MLTRIELGLAAVLTIACAMGTGTLTAATLLVSPDGVGGCKIRDAIRAANTDTAYGGCAAGSGTDTLVLSQYNDYPVFAAGQAGTADEDGNFTGDMDVTSSIVIQGASPEQTSKIDRRGTDQTETSCGAENVLKR